MIKKENFTKKMESWTCVPLRRRFKFFKAKIDRFTKRNWQIHSLIEILYTPLSNR